MKKIEATIQINKIDVVTSAIIGIVDGFTILEGNGRGSGKRQIVRSGRGTGTVVSDYNKVAIISTIVNDSEVEKISEVIVNAAFTGEEGDGIIAVSNIDSVLNITTKKKNSESL
jgi:nitrogen regulatory protein P-II 1